MPDSEQTSDSTSRRPRIHPKITHLAVPIDSVKPYPGNARTHNDAELRGSLIEHGQFRPLVVNEPTREILAGNGTWEQARALGWDEIAVTWVDVDPLQAKKINLVDNRLGDLAGYDDRLLAELIGSLGDDLTGTGYTANDLDQLIKGLDGPDAPDDFPDYGDDIPTDHQCPKCGYEWSGKTA
ncbi:ParB N-terminal domain-containing protein [Parafrankia discariae]|uniref:ParB N-terminal domain-containing protein n=1 Tax=Parafrankia discariae TaxID=365528 RepID=UPI00039D68F4|nr:ParB N-terminal domain-containing protein [Parafrankia discariae]